MSCFGKGKDKRTKDELEKEPTTKAAIEAESSIAVSTGQDTRTKKERKDEEKRIKKEQKNEEKRIKKEQKKEEKRTQKEQKRRDNPTKEELKEQLGQAKKDLNTKSEECNTLCGEISKAESAIATLTDKLRTQTTTLQQVETELVNAKEEYEKQNNQLELVLANEKEKGRLELVQAWNTIDELKAKLATQASILPEEKSKVRSDFPYAKEEYEKQSIQLRDEQSKLELGLALDKGKGKTELDQTIDTINEQTDILAKTNNVGDKRSDECSKLRAANAKAESQIAALTGYLDQAKRDLDNRSDECTKLIDAISKAESSSDALAVNLEKVRKNLAERSEECSKFRSERAQVESQIAALKDQAKKDLDQANKNLDKKSDECTKLNDEKAKGESQMVVLADCLEQAKKDLAKKSDEYANLCEEKAVKKIDTLTGPTGNDGSAVSDENNRLREEIAKAHSTIAELRGELQKIEDERNEAERRRNEIQNVSCLLLVEPGIAPHFQTARDDFMRRLETQLAEQKKSLQKFQMPPSGDLPGDAENLQKPRVLIMPCLAVSRVSSSIDSLMSKPAAKAGHILLFVVFHPRAPHDKIVSSTVKQVGSLPTGCVQLVDVVFNRTNGSIFDGGPNETALNTIADYMNMRPTEQNSQ